MLNRGPKQQEKAIGTDKIKIRNPTSPFLKKQSQAKPKLRRSFSEPNVLASTGLKPSLQICSLDNINLTFRARTFPRFIHREDNTASSCFQEAPIEQMLKIDAKVLILIYKNEAQRKKSRYSSNCQRDPIENDSDAFKPTTSYVIRPTQVIQKSASRLSEPFLPTAAQPNSRNINYISQCHAQEQRLARISTSIVWLFLLCHTWRMIPTFYEFWNSDNGLNVPEWPFSLVVIEHVSHSLILLNSAINFLVYIFM